MSDVAKRGRGRPPAIIDRDRLGELAGLGLTAEQVADRLGISRRTLFERMANEPELREAFEQGLSRAIETAALGIKSLADAGNVTALIFWLKAKAGWLREQAPSVVVNVGSHISSVDIGEVEDLVERQRLLIEGHAAESRLVNNTLV